MIFCPSALFSSEAAPPAGSPAREHQILSVLVQALKDGMEGYTARRESMKEAIETPATCEDVDSPLKNAPQCAKNCWDAVRRIQKHPDCDISSMMLVCGALELIGSALNKGDEAEAKKMLVQLQSQISSFGS